MERQRAWRSNLLLGDAVRTPAAVREGLARDSDDLAVGMQRGELREGARLVGVAVDRHDDGAVGEVVVRQRDPRGARVDRGDLQRASVRIRSRQQRGEVLAGAPGVNESGSVGASSIT